MNLPLRFLLLFTVLSCGLTFRLSAQAASSSATSAAAASATTPDASTTTAPPAIDPAKEAEIRKMLELNGTAKLMVQVKAQMFATFRAHQTGVSSEMWDRMDKDMDTNELLERLIPLYDKYYTIDDLKAANAFYQTPSGQHLIAAMPQLMAESSKISQEWGRQVGMKVMLEMQNSSQRMSTTPPPASSAAPTPAPAPAPASSGN